MTAPAIERLIRHSYLSVAFIAAGVLVSWAVGWGHLALPGRPSRMMAGSTASLLGSLALMTLARVQLPALAPLRWLERLVGLAVIGVSAWMISISWMADFTNLTASFMTPYAAVVFMIAAAGSLAHSSATPSAANHHVLGTAGVLVGFSGITVLFGHVADVLNVFEQPLPALTTGIAFTALGLGLVGLGGSQSWPILAITAPAGAGAAARTRADRVAVVAVVLAFALMASVLIRDVYRQTLADQYQELAVIAEERASLVSRWYGERSADASTFFLAPLVEEELFQAMTAGAAHPMRVMVRNWLRVVRNAYGYGGVLLVAPDGRRIESEPDLADHFISPRLTDETLSALDRPGVVAWLVPVGSRPGSPVLVLVANTDTMLQPALASWSRSRQTTEVVLVTVQGDRAGFLTMPRRAITNVRPTFERQNGSPMPSARAARGEFGPAEGFDYRGVRVLAVSAAIPGTPWSVVAKIDRAEAVAPARETAWVATVAAAAFAAMVLLLVGTLRSRLAASAERQLQTLSAAVSQSPASIVITDLQGTILYVNPAFLDVTGYTHEDVIGQNPRILKSGHFTAADYQEMWKTLTAGQVWQGELQNKRKNGELFWEFVTISPLRDSQGRVYGYVGIKKDITADKRAAEERQQLQAQLAQSQKMESVGRLAGGVAHDFNNMLAVILGHAEMAVEDIGDPDRSREHLAEILDAAQRSAALTRQLLAFARKQAATPRVLDLNHEVEDTLKMLRRLIGEDIHLVWTPGDALWRIRIDPSQVSQILANLSVNARDAITGAGTLAITTTNVTISQADARANIKLRPGEFVRLTVADSGSGMAPEVLAHLFEPFFTTKAPGKGTGLGTATVYGIVMQNHGLIDVQSEVGRGTTITIYLPRVTEEVDSNAVTPIASHPGTGTVLLVEDESSMLDMTRRMLERLGYTVVACRSAVQALDAARPGDATHLLLTDVVMPGMNGRELADALTTHHPQLKVVYMSGYTAEIIAPHGVLDEGIHFLPKPFTLAQLAAKLREAMEDQS
jgi:PAS domain S-box-containing protein